MCLKNNVVYYAKENLNLLLNDALFIKSQKVINKHLVDISADWDPLLQVNLLADSDLRFAPADRQAPPRPSTDIYFPRPPFDVAPGATATATTTARPAPALGITSAVYRPLGALAASSSGADGGGGALSGRRRARPFSLMLDIYPMPPAEYAAAAAANIPARGPRPHPAAPAPAPAHMVVHLNLYPRVRGGARSNSRSDGPEPVALAEQSGPTFHISVRPGGGGGEEVALEGDAGCAYAQGSGGGGAWASGDWAELLAQLHKICVRRQPAVAAAPAATNTREPPDLQERASRGSEHEILTEFLGRSAAAAQQPLMPSQDIPIEPTAPEMDSSGPEHTAFVPSAPGPDPTAEAHTAIDHTATGRSSAKHYVAQGLDETFTAVDPSGVAHTILPSAGGDTPANQLPSLEQETHGYAPSR
ncbi:Uncharacterized protein GBIM_12015 [Gryllus bimaculatus]|nr:Uncharacterized protein GBIM_12015 [Gryllus bimaculatus]